MEEKMTASTNTAGIAERTSYADRPGFRDGFAVGLIVGAFVGFVAGVAYVAWQMGFFAQ